MAHHVDTDVLFEEFMRKASSRGKSLVVVDFSASWCGPCQHIAPFYDHLSCEYKNVLFLKVDVDENEATKERFQINCMPTFIFLSNSGREMDRFEGASKKKLRAAVEKYGGKKHKHNLRVGDEVVSKYPAYRGKGDNPWFAGKVDSIEEKSSTCVIMFSDGDIAESVMENEVRYCSFGVDPLWGKGKLRGNDLIPEGALDVTIGPRKIRVLQVGDEVVARFPEYRNKGRSDENPWFAATIVKIDANAKVCAVHFEDGDVGDDLTPIEVKYCTFGRDRDWGKGSKRGWDRLPEGAIDVEIN